MTKIIIWDSQKKPVSNKDALFIIWNRDSNVKNKSVICLSEYIEKYSKDIRSDFLLWSHEINSKKIRSIAIYKKFFIRPNFSFWWMTLIFQKCNYANSQYINDVIKFFALARVIKENNVKKIYLKGCNKKNYKIFKSSSIFKRNIHQSFLFLENFINNLFKLFLVIQAISWILWYFSTRFPFIFFSLKRWKNSKAKITFLNYLDCTTVAQSKKLNFVSPYWDGLPKKLKNQKIETNWLHIYVGSFLNTFQAIGFLHSNKNGKSMQNHFCLDSFLTLKMLGSVFKDWAILICKFNSIPRNLFRSKRNFFDFSSFYHKDLLRSFYGKNALKSLLYLHLFESAFSKLPIQNKSIYLQENQSWEMAFLHSWKINGHFQSIGCPHSTIRFWDLRYHHYKDFYLSKVSQPDLVAVNGLDAFKSLSLSGFPKKKLRIVEALRYLYLKFIKPDNLATNEKLNILILGDFLSDSTHYLLKMIERIQYKLPKDTKITFKPHPHCHISLSNFNLRNVRLSRNSTSSLVGDHNIAITSNSTSAAVDAYYAGIKVITVLDTSKLNLSPFFNNRNIFFVESSQELLNALYSIKSKLPPPKIDKFLSIDESLNSWMKLLS